MASPDPSRPADKKAPSSAPAKYISSSGHVLETPPLSARFSRAADDIYNFLGLYIVSLFSLDPYTAAQNSQFNTRGRPNAYQDRARWGGVNRTGGVGAGPGPVGGTAGPRGGGGGGGGAGGSNGFGGGGPGRRIGTVEDVRSPECGSCG